MAEPLTPKEERYLRETHEWCVSDGMNHEAHRWIATLDAERALHPVSDATPDLAAALRRILDTTLDQPAAVNIPDEDWYRRLLLDAMGIARRALAEPVPATGCTHRDLAGNPAHVAGCPDALAVAGVAPSPDAPGLREALERIAKGHDWQPGQPTHGWASCQRIADAAIAASGDAPREGLREAAMAAVHADAALVKATNEGDDDDVDEASAQYAETMDRLAAALAATPDAPDWERLYTEEAERYARLSNVHAKCAPSPDAPEPKANSKSLRVAAQRVLDDWNRIGAQDDGYRALRAALAASGDAPRDGLDVERLEAAQNKHYENMAYRLHVCVGGCAADIAREYASESHPTGNPEP